MDVIAFRTPSGRYLTVHDDPRMPMVLRPAPLSLGAIFYRVPFGSRYTLRPFVAGRYAGLAGRRMVITPEATEITILARSGGRFAVFAVSNNVSVSLGELSDGSVAWGDVETEWTIESLDPLMTALAGHNCCGGMPPRTPQTGDALVFDLLIDPIINRLVPLAVDTVVRLTKELISHIVSPAVMALVEAASSVRSTPGKAADMLAPAPPGHPAVEEIPAGTNPALRSLARGFVAANHEPHDVQLPMTRAIGGAAVKVESLYGAHYYDPDTRGNFLGAAAPRTAWTECVRWFRESVSAEEDHDALFQLGLATHFLCDLCRPLHAANLAPVAGEPADGGIARDATGKPLDWRHNVYEIVAASEEQKYRPSTVRRLGYTDVESLAHQSAVAAKAIYNECLRDIARARRQQGVSYWSAAETAAAVRRSVELQHERNSELLALWIANRRIRDSFRPHFAPGGNAKWLFRATNAEEWYPGAFQHGRGKGAARVEVLTYRRVRLSGTYDFMWGNDWNNGSMYIEIRDIEPATCTLEIGQMCVRGNIWGERDRGAAGTWSVNTLAVTHGLSADGRKMIYRQGERVVMTQELYQPFGWQPAIRFELEFFGQTQYAVFERV